MFVFINEKEFKTKVADEDIMICLFVSEPVNSYVPSEIILTTFPERV